MKTFITSVLSLIIVFTVHSQKRAVDVGSFNKLSLGIPANVYLKQGSKEQVEIDCDKDIFDEIEFEMRGEKLVIKKENDRNWGSGWRKSEVDIYVTMKEIEGLSVSGSGFLESDGNLETGDIELAVSGSGDMDLALSGDELAMRISGSGSIGLEGKAKEAEVRISGSGKVKAEDMTFEVFDARISGSGSCYVTVTEEIEASISGSGSIYYKGNPERINSNSSGSGKVRKM